MILLLDTSTGLCKLSLIKDNLSHDYEWQADRTLAQGLLSYIKEKLRENDSDFTDLSAIGVLKGPGSFTGLRIGITVLNTLASSLGIPIVGEAGDEWKKASIEAIDSGQNDEIVMPFYGSEANITKPRK